MESRKRSRPRSTSPRHECVAPGTARSALEYQHRKTNGGASVSLQLSHARWQRGSLFIDISSTTEAAPVQRALADRSGTCSQRIGTLAQLRWPRPHPWKVLSTSQHADEPLTPPPSDSGGKRSAAMRLTPQCTLRNDAGPPTAVSLDAWNCYWEVFSDTYGDSLDTLGQSLRSLDASNATCYRRVLVGLSPSPTKSQTGNVGSSGAATQQGANAGSLRCAADSFDDLVFEYAHRFGAVEYLEVTQSTSGVLVSVQFTTVDAAGLFFCWAQGLSVYHLVRWYPGQCNLHLHNGIDEGGNSMVPEECPWMAEGAALKSSRLIAKLAPHDPRRVSKQLLLGPNVLISTAFVDHLFTGLFKATEVRYNASVKSFLILFDDVEESRLALHALQCSLWCVFRFPLIFV